MHLLNVEKTISGFPDLPTNPLAPKLNASRAFSLSSVTVKTMNGTLLPVSRSAFRNSKPLVPGMLTSHIIASGCFFVIFSMASSTEEADVMS